jgi:uncharacterized protein DUF5655
MTADPTTPEAFFRGSPLGLELFRAVAQAVDSIAVVEIRVSKSQIALRRRRGFAYVWRPGQHLKSDVPAVLSIALDRPLDSPRFKEVVHPSVKVWMHHLVLREIAHIDHEVTGWLREAYESAA